MANREELLWRAADVFKYLATRAIEVRIAKIYPLAEAAAARRDLQSRQTAGKLLLKVR
jgi:NADPH2:quinone reductase